MMNNKPFTKLFKLRNALTGLYYRRAEGFGCPESSGATLVDEAELAVVKYCYLNVEAELFGIKMLEA